MANVAGSHIPKNRVDKNNLRDAWESSLSGFSFQNHNAQLVLVALQRDAADDTSPFGHVVNDAHHVMHSVPHSKITFSRREKNKVAHLLARLSLALDNQLIWFEEP